jgi:uncharacterized protein (DUF1778 family)
MANTEPHEDKVSRGETINLRASAEQKALIDRAAARLGKSRTEFMLDAARKAAVNTLLDQRMFLLGDAAYEKFTACLDAPARPTKALGKLLTTPAPWD